MSIPGDDTDLPLPAATGVVLPVSSPAAAHVVNKRCDNMDFSSKWGDLSQGPSLKHLSEPGFGVPRETQHAAIQDITKAHIESFDQAVTEGLGRVVQVRPGGLLSES